MDGELAILNVSAGDTKLTFDPKAKAETKRACTVVTDMLRRGYCVLVEAGRDDKGPLYRRVQKFDPKTAEYIIAGDPLEETTGNAQAKPTGAPSRASKRGQGRQGSVTLKRVPASTARAVAVAPTSGG